MFLNLPFRKLTPGTIRRIGTMALVLICNIVFSQAVPPDTLLFFPIGTGQTTGHVMDLTITNPGGVSVKLNLGPWLIPGKGDYQGYVIPAAYQAVIPPLGSVNLSLNGYCTDVFKQALPGGEWGPDFRTWVSAGAGGLIPGPGWSPDSAYQAAGEGPPAALNLSFPGTRKKFPFRVDVQLFPQESANLLIDAAQRLEDSYHRLEAMAKLPALKGLSAEDKMQTFVQQGLWVFAAQLGGKYYSQADFALQYLEEAEQRFNHLRHVFSPAAQQQVALQAEDIWRGVQLVGLEARLFTPPGVDEDMMMPFQTWLDEQVNSIDLSKGLVAQWAVLKDTLLRVQTALDTSKFDSLLTELNGKFPAVADKFLVNLKLQKPEKAVNDALAALEFAQSAALDDLPKKWVAQWQGKLQTALGEHYGRALDLIDRADPQATPIALASFDLYNEQVRFFLPDDIRNKTLSKIREKIRPILERDVNAINATNEAAGETIFRLLDALQQNDFVRGIPAKKVTELRRTLEQKKLEYLSSMMGRINAADSTALRRMMALNVLMQSELGRTLPLDSLETWKLQLESQWIVWLDSTIRRIDPNTQSAIRTALSTLELLHSGWPERLGEDDPVHQAQVTHKLRSWFQGQVQRLQPTDTTFLSTWRTLANYQSAPWYHANLGAEFSRWMETQMNKQLADFAGGQTGLVQPDMLLNQSLQATGAQWKRSFNPPPPPEQKQKNTARNWLIGAGIGAGVGAGVLILLNRKGEPSPPTPPSKPQALPDMLTLSCPGNGSVNVLANDSGEGLSVTALGSVPAGVTVAHTGGGMVQVTTAGYQGPFSFSYTITDVHQQTAGSTVSVTVQDNQPPLLSCPPNVTVACGSDANPALTGMPIANDACAAPASLMIAFSDQTGGTLCLPVIQRRWVAVDPAGNSASCLQQITQNCNISATFQLTPSICTPATHDYNNGAATINLSPAGSYAITWSNGGSGATISALTPGAYTATVSSPASGCTKVFQTTIPYQPAFILTATNIKQPSSPSATDGQISVSVTPNNNAWLPLHVYLNGNYIGAIIEHNFTFFQLGNGVYTIVVIDQGGNGCPSDPLTVQLQAPESPNIPPDIQWSTGGIAPGLFMDPGLDIPDLPDRLTAALPEHPSVQIKESSLYLTRLPWAAAFNHPIGNRFFWHFATQQVSGEQWHYLESAASSPVATPFTLWSQGLSIRRQSTSQRLPWFAGAGLQHSSIVWGKSMYEGTSLGNLIDGQHQWSLYGTAGGRWTLSRYATLVLEGRVQTAFASPGIRGSLALNICWTIR